MFIPPSRKQSINSNKSQQNSYAVYDAKNNRVRIEAQKSAERSQMIQAEHDAENMQIANQLEQIAVENNVPWHRKYLLLLGIMSIATLGAVAVAHVVRTMINDKAANNPGDNLDLATNAGFNLRHAQVAINSSNQNDVVIAPGHQINVHARGLVQDYPALFKGTKAQEKENLSRLSNYFKDLELSMSQIEFDKTLEEIRETLNAKMKENEFKRKVIKVNQEASKRGFFRTFEEAVEFAPRDNGPIYVRDQKAVFAPGKAISSQLDATKAVRAHSSNLYEKLATLAYNQQKAFNVNHLESDVCDNPGLFPFGDTLKVFQVRLDIHTSDANVIVCPPYNSGPTCAYPSSFYNWIFANRENKQNKCGLSSLLDLYKDRVNNLAISKGSHTAHRESRQISSRNSSNVRF